MRQMMLANNDLDIDTKRIWRPQHFDHPATRRPPSRREICDLHINRQTLQRSVRIQFIRPVPLLCPCFLAQNTMRRFYRHRWNLRTLRNQNRAPARRTSHPLIQRSNVIPVNQWNVIPRAPPMRPRVMEDPHHRRISPVQYPRNSPRPPSISPRRRFVDENLIPLHRAVQLIRWNEKIISAIHASVRPHKPIPIAMQIQPSRHEPVSCGPMLYRRLKAVTLHPLRLFRSRRRQTPLHAVRLHQLPARRNPRKLLQQQPTLAPAAQAQLANQLLIPRAMPRRAFNQPHQLTISLWIGSVCHRLRAYSQP